MTKRKSTKEEQDETAAPIYVLSAPQEQVAKVRALSLFGDLDEEQVEGICHSLLLLKESGKEEIYEDPEDIDSPLKEIIYKPIDFYISTWGGDALGMFAIYDLLRVIREECEIHTFGLGKVMSAGVLLLASGTKGKRKIGKHTRVMMHSVRAGHTGTVHSLENDIKETKWIQQQHIEALVSETKMTKAYIKRMLNKKIDVYLNATQAVKLGIADIIV